MSDIDFLKAVEHAYPDTEMPDLGELMAHPELAEFHSESCLDCKYYGSIFNAWSQGDRQQLPAFEWGCLSAPGTKWALAVFLRYFLLDRKTVFDAQLDRLIFHLSVAAEHPEYEDETTISLSLLNNSQIVILKDFLLRLSTEEQQSDFMQQQISLAIHLLDRVPARQT
jgi:hypothetical protein